MINRKLILKMTALAAVSILLLFILPRLLYSDPGSSALPLMETDFFTSPDQEDPEFDTMPRETELLPEATPDEEEEAFNDAFVKPGTLIYTLPQKDTPLAEEFMNYQPPYDYYTRVNLFDDVQNGLVRIRAKGTEKDFRGWVSEEDLIYTDNYKTFSYLKNTMDLDGDGKPETIDLNISVSKDANYTLFVNDLSISGWADNPSQGFHIVDIDPSDRYKEIIVEAYGPSNDYDSYFYYYDGNSLIFMGSTEGLCGSDRTVAGDGTVFGRTRGHLLHTWFYTDEYRLNSSRLLEHVPKDLYYDTFYIDCQDEEMADFLPNLTALISFKLLKEPKKGSSSFTVKEGDRLSFVGSDDKQWCLFETADKRQGWLRVEPFYYLADMKANAGEVIQGLSYAD